MADKASAEFFSESVNKKLPLLFVSLVFFLVTLYTFFTTGITLGWLFDFGSFVGNPTQLYSLQLIIFTIAFAITLSLSAFFGNGLSKQQALIPLALFFVVSLASFAVLPSHGLLFIAFALAFGSAGYFASTIEKFDIEGSSTATRRALTVLLVLVVLFSIAKVELNKEAYFDQFLGGAAGLAPQLAQQVLPLCVEPFSKVNPETVVPASATDIQAESLYNRFRTAVVADVDPALAASVPLFAELPPERRQELQEEQRSETVASVRQLLTGLTEQLTSTELQQQVANFEPTQQDIRELRSQLRSVSYFQLVETYFSIFVAFIIFSILSAFTMVVKILNYPLNFILIQLGKLNIEAKE